MYDGGQKDHKCNFTKIHVMVRKVIASTAMKPTQITRCLGTNPIPEITLFATVLLHPEVYPEVE